MVAIAPPLLTPTPIRLDGIRWQTFQALVAELTEEEGYRLSYTPEQLILEASFSEAEHSVDRVLLKGIRWSTYRLLMTDVGDDRAWRIAYVNGVLELRMPLEEHEEPKRILEDLVIALVDEFGLEVRSLGALLLERAELSRAIEPDSCFYIQNEARVRGKKISLPQDPPPDLALESDHTHSSLNKHDLYAALGVPELWRYTKQTLQVYVLVNGVYELSDRSLAFPNLPIADVPAFLAQSKVLGQRAALREFRAKLREPLQ